MSLRLKLLGRAQPRLVPSSCASPISRVFLTCSCAPATRIFGQYRLPHLTYSTVVTEKEQDTRITAPGDRSPSEAPSDNHPPSPAAVVTPTTRNISRGNLQSPGAKLLAKAELSLKDAPDPHVIPGARKQPAGFTRIPMERDSILEPVAMRYPNRKETAASLSRYHNKLNQKVRVEQLHARHDANQPDWREVLSLLRSHTPLATWDIPGNRRSFKVPDELMDVLLHSIDDTLWDIADRTECELRLRRRSDGREVTKTLSLAGSDGAIERAQAEVLKLLAGLPGAGPLVVLDGPQPSGTVRNWTSRQESGRPTRKSTYVLQKRHEEINEPVIWTKTTLVEYFNLVLAGRISRQTTRACYGPGEEPHKHVADLLEKHLFDDKKRSALSTHAFTLALKYLASYGTVFRPRARQIVRRMMDTGTPMSTSIFNILLKSNVGAGDLRSFQTLLRSMTKSGFVPNMDTWSSFIRFVEDREVKEHILRSMNDRGLLGSVTGRQLVARSILPYDLEQARGRWNGIKPFLEEQHIRYGPGWLAQGTMNMIIQELGRMGKLASMLEFLDLMNEHSFDHVRLNLETLEIVLHHAKVQLNPALALVALSRLDWTKALSPSCYHELFKLFFAKRDPNALGVAWRFACMDGATTYHMRTIVSDWYQKCPFLLSPDIPMSITTSTDKGESRTQANARNKSSPWNRPHLPTLHEPYMLPSLVVEAGKSSEPEPVRNIGNRIAHLYHAQLSSTTWRPVKPLHILLAEALQADGVLKQQTKQKRQEACQTLGIPEDKNTFSRLGTPTKWERTTAPGIPFLLVRREQSTAPVASAQHDPQHSETPANASVEVTVDDARKTPEVVRDITAVIHSRTYAPDEARIDSLDAAIPETPRANQLDEPGA